MSLEKSSTEPLPCSSDRQVNALLSNVVTQLLEYTDKQVERLNQLAQIGVALSTTRNIDELLEMIVDQARAFTNSDGGTLYLTTDDEQALQFKIVQTESLKIRMGGIRGAPINWPPVPLFVNATPNMANVSAAAASRREVLNIPDVYEAIEFNFEGTRKFDASTGYRSKSMLVVPLKNHEDSIIGVLQLINATDPETGELLPYDKSSQQLTTALASQAAVAITNTRLINDLQALFEAFIQAIASAIDEKSPYTGGHIARVANLTLEIAKRINQVSEGHFAAVHFTDDELTELRIAGWLHDTGKITTPEAVVDKRTKLEAIFDRKELVRYRFETAIANTRHACAESILNLYRQGEWTAEKEAGIIAERDSQILSLMDDYRFLDESNVTAEFVPDAAIARIMKISEMTVTTTKGEEKMLTEDELKNMLIRKGNLTVEERKIIENHATMTIKILNKLPFPKKLRRVPEYAGGHHEKLDGTGYPLGLKGDQIALQARIMALADVFEALSAKDRPYKKEKKLSEVLKIMGFMAKDSHLDGDVLKFFLEQKMHIDYAKEHLNEDQLDIE